jgi:hypothetical protein
MIAATLSTTVHILDWILPSKDYWKEPCIYNLQVRDVVYQQSPIRPSPELLRQVEQVATT